MSIKITDILVSKSAKVEFYKFGSKYQLRIILPRTQYAKLREKLPRKFIAGSAMAEYIRYKGAAIFRSFER